MNLESISQEHPGKNRYSLLHKSFFLFLLLIAFNSIRATGTDTLFLSDEILNIELRSDFKAIQKDRTGEPVYHDGELIYHSPQGSEIKFSVRVMARGNFRRDPEHCDFPPLFINFKKGDVKNTIFDKQNKIKLVTHCQSEEDLIEEYLVYKMYNRVTDRSINVRMARILYFDISSGRELFRNYSFFIEDMDRVAERNYSEEFNKFITPFSLERDNYMKLAFFQYMIGNKDWFVTSRQNIALMWPADTTLQPFAVPYDFDFSGMIDADYSKPEGVPEELLSPRRVYQGICYEESELKEVFDFYRKLRSEFEMIIKSQKLLSAGAKKRDLAYIRNFYRIIDDTRLIKQEFLDKCQTKKDYNISG